MQVPEYSACIDGYYVEKDKIEANHMEMCKFDDSDDIGYKRVAGFISEFVNSTFEKKAKGEP